MSEFHSCGYQLAIRQMNTSNLAVLLAGASNILNDFHHVRVARLARHAETDAQVAHSYVEPIHAVRRCNLVDDPGRFGSFDLD